MFQILLASLVSLPFLLAKSAFFRQDEHFWFQGRLAHLSKLTRLITADCDVKSWIKLAALWLVFLTIISDLPYLHTSSGVNYLVFLSVETYCLKKNPLVKFTKEVLRNNFSRLY